MLITTGNFKHVWRLSVKIRSNPIQIEVDNAIGKWELDCNYGRASAPVVLSFLRAEPDSAFLLGAIVERMTVAQRLGLLTALAEELQRQGLVQGALPTLAAVE